MYDHSSIMALFCKKEPYPKKLLIFQEDVYRSFQKHPICTDQERIFDAIRWGETNLIIAFLRHPSPVGWQGRCYGRMDLALAPESATQVEDMIAALTPLCHATVWSSPALRCLQPAVRIASALNSLPPQVDARLAELDFGTWEGMKWDEIDRGALDLWAADPLGFRPPGGESGAQLQTRVTGFYQELQRLGGDHIVITHGGPLKILLPLAAGKKPDILAPAPAFASVTLREAV